MRGGAWLRVGGRLAGALGFLLALIVVWSLGWMHGAAAAVAAHVALLALVAGALTLARRRREQNVRASARGALRVLAPAFLVSLLVPAWSFGGPVVGHARSAWVRRALEDEHPGLAWSYRSVSGTREANWVAASLERASEPLDRDLGVPPRVGPQARPGRPAATGLGELLDWADAELASPRALVLSPPGVAAAYLEGRAACLDEGAAILLSGDLPRWGHAVTDWRPHHLRDVLLADALAKVAAGDAVAAERRMLASWRLAQSMRSERGLVKRSFAWSAEVAAALRRLPDVPREWDQRLSDAPYRTSAADTLVAEAAQTFGFADDVAEGWRLRGTDRRPLDWMLGPVEAWTMTAEARRLMEGSAMVREAERRCEGLGRFVLGREPPARLVELMARQSDAVAAHFELTRKVADAKRRRTEGRYPASIEGVSNSSCPGMWWRYEGGVHLTLAPRGDAVRWVSGLPGWPALAHAEP